MVSTVIPTRQAPCRGDLVHSHTIDYDPMVGTSKIRARLTLDLVLRALRTVMDFHPLKLFPPVGAVFFGMGPAGFLDDVEDFSWTPRMGRRGGTQPWSVGLRARLALRGSGP